MTTDIPITPADTVAVDVCVIGAGAAGLAVAAGAVRLGLDVALAESGPFGGAALHERDIPMAAWRAAARAAHDAAMAGALGVRGLPVVDFDAVRAHVRRTIARIAPHDSPERFESLGVRVLRGAARFTGPHTLRAGDTGVQARAVVIATGAAPRIPAIPGLDPARVLTGGSLLNLEALPAHMLVLGGGACGLETAQVFRRLGAQVTVIERDRILRRHDPDCRAVLQRCLMENEGIRIIEQATVTAARADGGRITLDLAGYGPVTGSHVFAACGRTPRTSGLGLAEAGIPHDEAGITVDARLRAGRPHVYALGGVAGGPHAASPCVTHAVRQQALIVLAGLTGRRARRRGTAGPVPLAAFTDPEIACVGLDAATAQDKYGRAAAVTHWGYRENDRARAELQTEGFARIVTVRGRVAGAAIVGAGASEMIGLWALAAAQRLPLRAVAAMAAATPTYTEISQRAAAALFYGADSGQA